MKHKSILFYRRKGFLWRLVFNKKYTASQDKVFRKWTSYEILNRTTLTFLTLLALLEFHAYVINVIAISFSRIEKSTVNFAGSKHRSCLNSSFVFLKVLLNMLFNFLTLFTWFSCKKNKNAYFWALGPLGPRGPNRRFFS